MCVCVCVCKPSLGVIPQELFTLFFRQDLSLTSGSLVLLGWLASEPQGSTHLCFLSAGLQVQEMWVLEIELGSSCKRFIK